MTLFWVSTAYGLSYQPQAEARSWHRHNGATYEQFAPIAPPWFQYSKTE
ncbi:MAG: hypothetical protein VKJ24_17580 [Synechococcales bacterium]|nr:hypothetical protein [Synechococcales bacterium]